MLSYTKLLALKRFFWILMVLVISSFLYFSFQSPKHFANDAQLFRKKRLMVGAERLDLYFDSLVNKRVAIVGNQTSVIGKTHLVDTLINLGIPIQKVFSPEHGFRGQADNGEKVDNEHDEKTGVDVISLYGNNRKPTAQQLSDVDIVVFDIQDVGVRFYTYISTLHYIIEACAENNVQLIVLDRPNPNGHYIDGPVLDIKNKSFIGMHPVPIVYGMTIGEYASMINNECWTTCPKPCDLLVVPCANYSHTTKYSLPVAPSPNLRSDLAVALYPSLCLFEGTTVSIGRGTEQPFEIFGHPRFPETDFQFKPVSSFGSKKPTNENKICFGYNLKSIGEFKNNQLNIEWVLKARTLLGDSSVFIDQPSFFDRLAGNSEFRKQVMANKTDTEIRKTWEEDLQHFKLIRRKYLIYN